MSKVNITSDSGVQESGMSNELPRMKLVYSIDVSDLLLYGFDKLCEELKQNQYCCQECVGYADDSLCQCVKSLEKRSGKSEFMMSASTMDSEFVCQKILSTATRAIEYIKEKTFFCECPSVGGVVNKDK